jgi:hypothetical protein
LAGSGHHFGFDETVFELVVVLCGETVHDFAGHFGFFSYQVD